MQQEKSQKELLRQQFQLVAPNLKSILVKKQQLVNYHERQLLVNILKKVVFIRSSFDTCTPKFTKMALNMILQVHRKNDVVFQKGAEGQYFYIVLEGIYCVQIENVKQRRKEKPIFYYPGDSFGQVSLIYNVPRGATIIADQNSSLMKIHKKIFNQCGDLQSTILYLNKFFQNHSFFQKQSNFTIRVFSSLSKLVKFRQDQVLIQEGQLFNEIYFFVKGEAKVFKTLQLQNNGVFFEETIQIEELTGNDVFGEYYYMSKEPSAVRLIATNRGQYIKVSFKQDIRSVETPLSKRIKQNAMRFPSDQQLLDQYKIYCEQKLKQLQFMGDIYNKSKNKNKQLIEAQKRAKRVRGANLTHRKNEV